MGAIRASGASSATGYPRELGSRFLSLGREEETLLCIQGGGKQGSLGPVERMRPEDLGIGKLFEKVRDAVVVAEARTQRIVLWNPTATKIFGYSTSEAL